MQITYLIMVCHPEWIKNSYNSMVKDRLTTCKWAKDPLTGEQIKKIFVGVKILVNHKKMK